MKKNLMMRLASGLLVAVLLTTCAISGTFAKYVTSDNVADAARVAKWGVVVKTEGHLFSNSYKNNETTWTANEDTLDITVQAKTAGTDVVAPGTKNDTGMTFTLTGTPEVDTNVEFEITVNEDVFLKQNNNLADMTTGAADTFNNTADYYPVVFTLKNGAGQTLMIGNLTVLQTYLEGLNGNYDTNEDLAAIGVSAIDSNIKTDGTYKLTWAWDYTDTPDVIDDDDRADTLLGNLAADAAAVNAEMEALGESALLDGTDYNLNIDVSISITVTQID